MKNAIFAVNHGMIKHGEGTLNDHAAHVLVGVDENGKPSISHGVDYGGNCNINNTGALGSVSVDHVLLMPISGGAALRYKDLVDRLVDLRIKRREPFYYSCGSIIIPEEELESTPAIDLHGRPEESPDPVIFARYQKRMIDTTEGLKVQNTRRHPEGLVRARAGCVTMSNFVAELSGIDLKAFDPEWHRMQNSQQFAMRISALFDTASEPECIDDKFELRRHFDSSTRRGFLIVKTLEAGHQVRARHILGEVADWFGGMSNLAHYMDDFEPFDCPPAPVPKYLQNELDRLPQPAVAMA